MRIPILVLAFALASCGDEETADPTAVRDETSSTQLTTVNDVTAIDAATGQAAEMAADVNYMLDENEFGEDADNAANSALNESL